MEFDLEYDSLVEKNYHLSNSIEVPLKDFKVTEFFEEREVDQNDELKVKEFYTKDCCDLKCNKKIPMEEAVKQRYNFLELSKAEQDLVILSHLQMHRRLPFLRNEYVKKNQATSEMERQKVTYYFADLTICREMYFFLHNIGRTRYKNLINHFDQNGISIRDYKLLNKLSTRSDVLTFRDIENVVHFIKAYASKVAIPLPGRLPQFRKFEKVVKLPSSDTKAEVYRKFEEAAENDENIRIVARSTFFKIWNDHCSEIMTMKPASDLCTICRENNLNLLNLSSIPTDEQAKLIETARSHLENARVQRDYYNSHREMAKSENGSLLVISFDYAQNVSYPSSPQQVGSSYFKANRKCGLFGLNNEATNIQMNITIDEQDNTGKGANAVISMLNYYLTVNVVEKVVLFADNCAGQNKNNALLHYLLWRIMTKLNASIELNFMLTGHTKFSPDRNFGIIKSKFAKANVDCHEDFIDVIRTSSPNQFNTAVPSIDPTTKIRNIFWAQWDKYLQQFFKPIPNLSKFHYFKFHPDGSIKAKVFANSPEQEIRKKGLLTEETFKLQFIEPEGISAQRAWYLYKEIRPLCLKESSKDLIAPKPNVPMPKQKQKNDTVNIILQNAKESQEIEKIGSQEPKVTNSKRNAKTKNPVRMKKARTEKSQESPKKRVVQKPITKAEKNSKPKRNKKT